MWWDAFDQDVHVVGVPVVGVTVAEDDDAEGGVGHGKASNKVDWSIVAS